MATNLGKRKRRTAESTKASRQKQDEEEVTFDQDAEEIFRRHFEAQFRPLPEVKNPVKPVEKVEEDPEEESEWGGISDEDDGVQIIEHTDIQARTAAMSKEQLKAFMVCSYPPLEKNTADEITELETAH